jgi:hypothetical protein
MRAFLTIILLCVMLLTLSMIGGYLSPLIFLILLILAINDYLKDKPYDKI